MKYVKVVELIAINIMKLKNKNKNYFTKEKKDEYKRKNKISKEFILQISK